MPHFRDVYFHKIQWDKFDYFTQFSSSADVGFFLKFELLYLY